MLPSLKVKLFLSSVLMSLFDQASGLSLLYPALLLTDLPESPRPNLSTALAKILQPYTFLP